MSYELEDEQAPLTKPRKSKQKVDPIIETEPLIDPPIEPLKPKKPRAPKTEKQLAVFKEKCALARKNNIKKQKDTIVESAKEILKKEMSKPKKTKEPDTESESEPEVIHIKKPKRKPKKKIIVVHSDSSSSESSSSEEEEHISKKQFGRSHRNKKSIPQPKPIDKPKVIQKLNNFFAD
jgi:hypothetical protein